MADQKVSVPLMHAFRAAFEAHDARERVDLRDQTGERVISARRSRVRGIISETTLRREVARDLDQLLNTIALGSSIDLGPYPEAARSIINFGIPDIVHLSIDDMGVSDIAGDMAEALRIFEPRLAAESIVIKRDDKISAAGLAIRYTVRAELLSNPVNIPVEFVADVEMDSGKIRVSRF